MVVSVPITNKERVYEPTDALEALCDECGFAHWVNDDSWFHIETPVGSWRFDLMEKPIHLMHINRVKGSRDRYHVQPRLFLSFKDAFRYIERHDELVKRLMQHKGTVGQDSKAV